MKTTNRSFLVGNVNSTKEFMFDDVIYCRADSNYTEIYLRGRRIPVVVSLTLKEVEKRFSNRRFYRVNRGILLNLDYIKYFNIDENDEVELDTGELFAVSFRRRKQFKEFMANELQTA